MIFEFKTGFCPSCGTFNFSSSDDKKFECAGCGFILYRNMAAAVVAIIKNQHNEILFTIRKNEPSKGMLDLPGGFVDPGETAENALIREVKEELNLDIVGYKYMKSYQNEYFYRGVTYRTLDLVFICEVDTLATLAPADDVAGYCFIPLSEVNVLNIGLQSIRTLISEFIG